VSLWLREKTLPPLLKDQQAAIHACFFRKRDKASAVPSIQPQQPSGVATISTVRNLPNEIPLILDASGEIEDILRWWRRLGLKAIVLQADFLIAGPKGDDDVHTTAPSEHRGPSRRSALTLLHDDFADQAVTRRSGKRG
jgi:hypothetical protein